MGKERCAAFSIHRVLQLDFLCAQRTFSATWRGKYNVRPLVVQRLRRLPVVVVVVVVVALVAAVSVLSRSRRSSHIVFPEHEHTVLSFSHTPALRAMTPTSTLASSRSNGPSCCLDTTMPRPTISHSRTAASRKDAAEPALRYRHRAHDALGRRRHPRPVTHGPLQCTPDSAR